MTCKCHFGYFFATYYWARKYARNPDLSLKFPGNFSGFVHSGDPDVQGQPGGQLPVAVAPRARRRGHEGLPHDQAQLALERVQPAVRLDGAGPGGDPGRASVQDKRRLQSHLQVAQRRHGWANATVWQQSLHQGRQLSVQRFVISWRPRHERYEWFCFESSRRTWWRVLVLSLCELSHL